MALERSSGGRLRWAIAAAALCALAVGIYALQVGLAEGGDRAEGADQPGRQGPGLQSHGGGAPEGARPEPADDLSEGDDLIDRLIEGFEQPDQRYLDAGELAVEGAQEGGALAPLKIERVRSEDPAAVPRFEPGWSPRGFKAPEAPSEGAFADGRFIKGAAVGLYGDLPGLDHGTLFKEIKGLGATHVSLVISGSMANVRAVEVRAHPVETAQDADVRRWIRQAREAGLSVMLFPILNIERRRAGEWRGKLAPSDPDRWWSSYGKFILRYADIAQQEGVDIFSVGSELLSLEGEQARWSALIKEVRGRFKGRLTYSANWDHFDHVTFWEDLDVAGMTGYFELAYSERPTLPELKETWAGAVDVIATYVERAGRPLILTEVGYPSQVGAAAHPWDYTRRQSPDPVLQYLSFRAMYEVYRERFASLKPGDSLPLHGVFVWNWVGYGGPDDITYTVRGKPAEAILRRWFSGL